ncbi:MAG: transporter substrate-binding domain-containing protein [Clostridia bacterium]|nr:transporter substrate-binding domain-containing protein [Clostridia bacterium]
MKKTIAIVLMISMLLVSVLALSSCGKVATLDSVKKAGKLTIATSPDFPPFENLEGGEVVGIEIDILNYICEKIGVKLEINQMTFESVLPGIQAGKFDLGVSGITITEGRKKNTLFTDAYYIASQAIVVTAGSAIAGKSDLTGKKVSVQTGTTAEEFCMDEGLNVSAFEANSDAQLALVTGKVDAWVIDKLTGVQMVQVYNAEHPDAPLVILDEAMTEEPYAFALKLGSDSLADEINKILKEMITNGTMAAIFAKYGEAYEAPAK